jgi:hypothetical protein
MPCYPCWKLRDRLSIDNTAGTKVRHKYVIDAMHSCENLDGKQSRWVDHQDGAWWKFEMMVQEVIGITTRQWKLLHRAALAEDLTTRLTFSVIAWEL